jgi:hypothetical protein
MHRSWKSYALDQLTNKAKGWSKLSYRLLFRDLNVADPNWIKKTLLVTLVIGAPAFALLGSAWRTSSRRNFGLATKTGLWLGMAFGVSYLLWILNVTFEWSAGAMILWPPLGVALSLVGLVSGILSGAEVRLRLLAMNVLLVFLSLFSIVVPN